MLVVHAAVTAELLVVLVQLVVLHSTWVVAQLQQPWS